VAANPTGYQMCFTGGLGDPACLPLLGGQALPVVEVAPPAGSGLSAVRLTLDICNLRGSGNPGPAPPRCQSTPPHANVSLRKYDATGGHLSNVVGLCSWPLPGPSRCAPGCSPSSSLLPPPLIRLRWALPSRLAPAT
jgi:hypothetical protein